MERITYRITLDAQKGGVQTIIQGFKQNESIARRIEISLVSRGEPYPILEGVTASMYIKKATGTSINACSFEDGKVIYDVSDEDLIFLNTTTPRLIDMQLKLVDQDLVLIAPKFQVRVESDITDDTEAEETPTYTALEEALLRAQTYANSSIESVVLDEDTFMFTITYADGTTYESDAFTNLAGIGDNEQARIEAEAQRVINEGNRQSHETMRVQFEEVRLGNEETRVINEETRQSNEEARIATVNSLQEEIAQASQIAETVAGYVDTAQSSATSASASATSASASATSASASASSAGESAETAEYWGQKAKAIAQEELGGLTDVDVINPSNGQVLTFRNGTWENENVDTSQSVSSLTDTSISSPSSGQVLKYNGSEWENGDVATKVSELTDATISNPADGQVLTFEKPAGSASGAWKNKNVATKLSELTDTAISNPSGGEFLMYDDSNNKWVNMSLANAVEIPVPKSKTYTYTGSEQTFEWDSIDYSKVDVTGDEKTNAGTYTVTCTLKSGMDTWSDDTTAPKTFSWTIDKADSFFTISPNAITCTYANPTATIQVSNASGTNGFTFAGINFGTASYDDSTNTITVTCTSSGTGSLSITMTGNANYNASTPQSVLVTSSVIQLKTFATATDAEIAQMVALADQGVIDLYDDAGWRVGQEHSISLGAISSSGTYDGTSWSVGESQSAQTVTLILLQKGGYQLTTPVLDKQGQSRSVCSFVVGVKEILSTTGYIDGTRAETPWKNTARRAWLNSGFRQAVPSDLRGAFKKMNVISAMSSLGSTTETTSDYFTLPATGELSFSTDYSNMYEATAVSDIDYYTSATSNRVKYKGSSTGTWWTRSIASISGVSDMATKYCCVDPSGSTSTTQHYIDNTFAGFSPFGCV